MKLAILHAKNGTFLAVEGCRSTLGSTVFQYLGATSKTVPLARAASFILFMFLLIAAGLLE